jgi:hypothetical protein
VSENELIGARWFKSSRSNGQANCVEVAFLDGARVAARDSKVGNEGGILRFAPVAWRAFVARETER